MAIGDYRGVASHNWDVNTLDWIRARQPVLEAGTVNIGSSMVVTGTVTATGPITDSQLRAADIKITLDGESVPVTGTFWPATQPVSGTFWQTTQPVSAASLPLPTGAATEASLGTLNTNTVKVALTPASGSVSGTGNNTLITPASGKKLRIHYLSYNPTLAVEAAFRFGASGTLVLRNSVAAGAVVAKDFGDMRYWESAVDEPLVLNMVVGVSCIWNALYTEV